MASAGGTSKDVAKMKTILQNRPVDLLGKNDVMKVWTKLEDCVQKKGERVETLFNNLETIINDLMKVKPEGLYKRKGYTKLKSSIIEACKKEKEMGVQGKLITKIAVKGPPEGETNEIKEKAHAFDRLDKLLKWLTEAVDGSIDVQMPANQIEQRFTPEYNLKCEEVEGYVKHIWKTYREKVGSALNNPTGKRPTTKDMPNGDKTKEIDALRKENRKLCDQIQDLSHRLQELEIEKQNSTTRNQELSQQNKETKHQQTKHQQTKQPGGQHSKAAKAMSDKHKELEETVQTLRCKIQELEEENKPGGMRNQQLNQQNNVNTHPQSRNPSGQHSQDAKAMPDKNKELDETVQTLRRRLQELEEEKKAGGMRHNEDQQGKFTELQEKVRDLKKQIQTLEDEKQHWITRVSKMAGDKLKENNPSITDLSDPNRPQKLAEQYGELYDNDWTDAMLSLNPKEDSKQERKCIDTLSSILKDCYEACKTKADKHMQDLENTCMMKGGKDQKIPSKAQECPQESKTNLQQAQKQTSMLTLETVTKIVCADLSKKISESKKVVQYVEKCVGVCWAMVVHKPRPCFAWPDSNEKQIRLDMFNHYTKSGDTLDFVVWPAMQLHESGPLLRKGTVQPK